MQSTMVGIPVTSLNAVTTTAATVGTTFAIPPIKRDRTLVWQVDYSGTPSASTIVLAASLDNVNFHQLDSSTNTAGEIRTVVIAHNFVRISQSSRTGATNVTAQLTVW